jgi:predicted phosphodiesterase
MELYAISDIHVGFEANRNALESVRPHPGDWLIVAGDVGETEEHLSVALDALGSRFQRLIWVPGNHELWTTSQAGPRGQAKYDRMVAICRSRGVLTPEDEYVIWDGPHERFLIAPLFLLYDYTFRPDHIAPEDAVAWAGESGIKCADEQLLFPDPYPSRPAWCAARCESSARRLERAIAATGLRTILINHFPLKHQLARLPAIPRFQVWCGTRRTEDWHTRFHAAVVISGHLHIRKTSYLDGCRFEEVSLGYPRQWQVGNGMDSYIKKVTPEPR